MKIKMIIMIFFTVIYGGRILAQNIPYNDENFKVIFYEDQETIKVKFKLIGELTSIQNEEIHNEITQLDDVFSFSMDSDGVCVMQLKKAYSFNVIIDVINKYNLIFSSDINTITNK